MTVSNVITPPASGSTSNTLRADGIDFKEVDIISTDWTSVSSPFTDLVQLTIQNVTGETVKINGAAVVGSTGYVGITLEDGDTWHYNDIDTSSGWEVFARSSTSAVKLNVEALTVA